MYYGPLPPIAFLYIPMRHGTADGKVVGQISSTLTEKNPHSQLSSQSQATEVAGSRFTDATYVNFLSTEQALELIRVLE